MKHVQKHSKACLTGCWFLLLYSQKQWQLYYRPDKPVCPQRPAETKKEEEGEKKIDRLYRWLEKSNQQQTCEKKAWKGGGGRSLHTGGTRESSALRITGRVPTAPLPMCTCLWFHTCRNAASCVVSSHMFMSVTALQCLLLSSVLYVRK